MVVHLEVLCWMSGLVRVQVDGMGLATGPPAPARGRMGLAWAKAKKRLMRLVKARWRCMMALFGCGLMLVLNLEGVVRS